jgi:hypothetical protein
MPSRRRFVAFVASAIPVALVSRRADALGARWIAGEDEVLRALAEAVLPSELDADARARVVHSFRAWTDDYKEGAELTHGYGTSALRFSRASQRVNWAAQLERLGTRHSALGTRPFIELGVEQRRAIVRDELKTERLDRMPAVASAPHVALALLAFYYDLPQAADLCHSAQIGRQTCRPLSQSSRKPLPLAGGRS